MSLILNSSCLLFTYQLFFTVAFFLLHFCLSQSTFIQAFNIQWKTLYIFMLFYPFFVINVIHFTFVHITDIAHLQFFCIRQQKKMTFILNLIFTISYVLYLCRYKFSSGIILFFLKNFNISCSAYLLAIDSIRFNSLSNVFILLSFMKKYFHQVKNSGIKYFFFQNRKMWFHYLPSCIVSDKKCAIVLIFLLQYTIPCLPIWMF